MIPKARRQRFGLIAAALIGLAIPFQNLPAETLLFIDDHEILYRSGTRKVLHQLEKFEGNPVIFPQNPELPWEKALAWVSVYRDPKSGKFQAWYQAYSGKSIEDKTLKSVVAYAESSDGIKWTKPKLKLFPYVGRGFNVPETNIVLVGAPDGYGDRYVNSVLVDEKETDPARRYKMAYYDWVSGPGEEGVSGLHVAFSPDGIHWTKHPGVLSKMTFGAKTEQPPYEDESVYFHLTHPDGREWRQWRYPATLSDALDVLYDPRLDRFVIYGKMWFAGPDGGLNWKHGMGRSESKDFINWSKPELIAYPGENDPPYIEFHTSPVFYHEGMYLSLNQLWRRDGGIFEIELISSRDGMKWDRTFAGRPVLPRGGGKAFDAGYLITNGNPIQMGDEMWFYYGAHRGRVRFPEPDDKTRPNAAKHSTGIGLAKIKRDRFVGIAPDPQLKDKAGNETGKGQITLKRRDLAGVRKILLNAKTEAEGAVRVEVLNARGYRIRGFTNDDAVPITGDNVASLVQWKEKSLADLPPGEYLLRIHLDRAEVFACELKKTE